MYLGHFSTLHCRYSHFSTVLFARYFIKCNISLDLLLICRCCRIILAMFLNKTSNSAFVIRRMIPDANATDMSCNKVVAWSKAIKLAHLSSALDMPRSVDELTRSLTSTVCARRRFMSRTINLSSRLQTNKLVIQVYYWEVTVGDKLPPKYTVSLGK